MTVKVLYQKGWASTHRIPMWALASAHLCLLFLSYILCTSLGNLVRLDAEEIFKEFKKGFKRRTEYLCVHVHHYKSILIHNSC